jgi:hypothetical protein
LQSTFREGLESKINLKFSPHHKKMALGIKSLICNLREKEEKKVLKYFPEIWNNY